MTKIINRGCNHCGGDLEYEEGDYKTSRWKCIQCDRTGEVSIDDSVEEIVTAIATVAAIVKPEKRVATRPKKGGHNSKYYNRYMEEILSDRLSIGHLAMLNKWGISTTNWSHIKPRWISAGIDIPDMRSKANMVRWVPERAYRRLAMPNQVQVHTQQETWEDQTSKQMVSGMVLSETEQAPDEKLPKVIIAWLLRRLNSSDAAELMLWLATGRVPKDGEQ